MRQPISGSGRSRGLGASARSAQVGVDLAGDVTLQAPDDLRLRQAFGGAPLGVGAGGRVVAHPGDHDPPQGMVGLPVAAEVEPVTGTFPDEAGSGRPRTGAPRRPPSAAAPGGPRPRSAAGRRCPGHAVQGEQGRRPGGHQRDDELIQALELAVEELRAPAQLPQRDAGGVADGAARTGPQYASSRTRAVTVCPANRARRSSGPVRTRDLAWLMVWVRSARALRLATISARIASTAPSRPFGAPRARPDWAARAALMHPAGRTCPAGAGPGGRSGPPRRPGCRPRDVAGQACAVAAGALDPDQGDGPEPAQPAEQAGVAGRGDRELLHAEQSPDGVQRGGDVRVGVGVHAAGNGAAVFYDGQGHPFSVVEGVARTRWPSDP